MAHIFSPGDRVRDMEDGRLGTVVVAPPKYRAAIIHGGYGEMISECTGIDGSGLEETTVQFDDVELDGQPAPSWRYSHMLEPITDTLFSEVQP